MTLADVLWWTSAIAYLAVSAGLFAYGMNYYYLAAMWARFRRVPVAARDAIESFPMVTVQLPVYNERYVAGRLIQAVAAFDWPRDRLEIQVLDDSDDDTPELIAPLVRELRDRGVRIEVLRRESRVGYKAGALAVGLTRASGQFLAIFDCDFVPPADFLRRAMPEFADPRVGLVQTRWGHLNREYSRLTQAQALGVDGHFAVEQEVRSRAGFLINFNGTAGIWRRTCIEDAGGWSADTLAEDLDLSYRAQLAGWRCAYRKDIVCPAELPAQLHAFKRQQFRWAKGSIQVFLKLKGRVLRSDLRPPQKVGALVHLSLYMVHPFMLASFLLLPPLLLSGSLHPIIPALFAMASLGPAAMYLASQWEFERPRFARRALLLPYLTILGMGQCLSNTKAVAEAFLGRRSAFLRTPKFGIVGSDGHWRGKRYALRGDWTAVGEWALAAYGVAVMFAALRLGNWWTLPWATLFTAGFVLVGALAVSHSHAGRLVAGSRDAETA